MPSSAFMPSNSNVRHQPLAGAIRAILFAGALIPAFAALAATPGASTRNTGAAAAPTPAATADRVRYTILLKGEPLATYKGGIAAYAAAPRIQSGRRAGRLDVHAPASLAYVEYLASRQDAFVRDLGTSLGRTLVPVAKMQHALNAVIVELTDAEADVVRRRNDVELVDRERMLELLTDRGPTFIGAPSIWDGSASGGVATQGEGIVAAVLDTGINWQSPAFAATGPIDGYVHVNPNGAGVYLGQCGPTPPNADFGRCNDKLIGMYDFTSTAADRSANDLVGHGSHTASTVGGNHWLAPFGGGTFTISGVAPHANVIAYRVCITSCASSASTQATNQAVIDGADVLNFSISGGVSPWSDSVSVAFRNAVDAGIFVAASAGNDGPAAATINHVEPWVETVAASTKDNVIGFRFNLTAPGTPPPATQNLPLRPAAPPVPTEDIVDAPIVRSPTFSDGSNDGCAPFAADTFTVPGSAPADTIFVDGFDAIGATTRIGAVAVLSLDQNASNCGSVGRRQAALDAGAIGVIFVDRDFINLGASETSWSMLRADWDAVWAEIEADPEAARASLLLPAASFPQRGDVVADFSSRGPRANGGQYLVKPDITAPGVDIVAAYTAELGGPTATAMENGTSMSSPHTAGSAALVRAVQPTWTPTQVRSALNMTSKIDSLIRADGSAVDPFDLGSGRIDLTRAALSGLVMDETTQNFVDANPSTGGDMSSLNLASLAENDCTAGTCAYTRTLTSTTLTDDDYSVSVSGFANGATVVATPATFTVAAGADQILTIEVDSTLLTAGWNYGTVTLTPDNVLLPTLRIPLALFR